MILKKITPIYKLIIFTIFCVPLSANTHSELTWMMSGRTHSELTWYTIKTKNFNVHYHKEIEDIAKAGANISEQVLPILMKQLNIDDIPRIDIILTSEDEVMNGFAIDINSTFIWVDQNDASIWIENGKWLEQVIAHELQHIVFFNKIKTWLPKPYNLMTNPDIPGWFVEGIAEYYTERWRPYRSEIKHKYHVMTNSTSNMDPHHDGYSKIKLMAELYGDSSIVNLLEHRTEKLKLFQFGDAFKHATGISVNEFNEQWRRTMNTYYYGFRAQKETYEDAGEILKLPIKKLSTLVGGFKFTNDSLHVAMIGKDDKNQYYSSLIMGIIDSTSLNKEDSKNLNDEKKQKIKYKKNEIDFGKFHPSINWSDNNRYLAYSKYHYANNNSMVWDLCIYDTKLEKKYWLTNNMRATYPIFLSDNQIIFIAHKNSISNLFKINMIDNKITPITNFTENTQIVSPSISNDKNLISFSMSRDDGNLNIYTLDLTKNELSKKTNHSSVDYLPIMDNDNNIIFTSHRTGMPNLFKLDENNNIKQCTDLSEGIWGVQQISSDGMILANTLNDVDSTRIIKINSDRTPEIKTPQFNDRFKLWKKRNPDIKIDMKDINRNKYDYSNSIKKYSIFKNIKHIQSSFIPIPGIMTFNTMWSDALTRNSIVAAMGNYYNVIDLYKDFKYNSLGNFLFFSYTNAMHGPLVGINYLYNNLNYYVRFYNGSTLLERMDGLTLWMSIPYNAGNSLYANHSLKTELIIANRTAIMSDRDITFIDDQISYDNDSDIRYDNIPNPKSGFENIIAINYKYLNRKPHKENYYLPKQGLGIEMRAEFANRPNNLYYQKYSIDAFINNQISIFVLYNRLKLESAQGDVFPQDGIFFSKDQPIYVSGSRGADNIFGENLSPRGWLGDAIIGNNMLLHTLEIRKGIPILLPFEALGIKPGKISIALFQDYGRINKKLKNINSIQTIGAEIKIPFLSANEPILFLSHGVAQTIEGWKMEEQPNYYIQFSLVNPF
tara:strand:- start:2807 stop:5809 length:3003 start_codon:yes stop_codon:yes gene_type:complete